MLLTPYKHYSIHVLDPPVTTTTSQSVYVNDGDVVLLNCSATGNPAPIYHWTRPDGTTATGSPLTFTATVSALVPLVLRLFYRLWFIISMLNPETTSGMYVQRLNNIL